MSTPLPLPGWVRLGDGFHVELISGANITRCNKHIGEEKDRSTKAVPTHCDECRVHYRDAVKAAREREASTDAPAPPTPDLVPQVLAAMGDLQMAVAGARVKHGRDAIRALPWGTTLDAMDSGRDRLHPDDLYSAIDDQMFIRWLLSKPLHGQATLLRRAWKLGGVAPLDAAIIYVTGGVPSIRANGASLNGVEIDRVLYTGPDCDPDWLRDVVAPRFSDGRAALDWRATLPPRPPRVEADGEVKS